MDFLAYYCTWKQYLFRQLNIIGIQMYFTKLLFGADIWVAIDFSQYCDNYTSSIVLLKPKLGQKLGLNLCFECFRSLQRSTKRTASEDAWRYASTGLPSVSNVSDPCGDQPAKMPRTEAGSTLPGTAEMWDRNLYVLPMTPGRWVLTKCHLQGEFCYENKILTDSVTIFLMFKYYLKYFSQ